MKSFRASTNPRRTRFARLEVAALVSTLTLLGCAVHTDTPKGRLTDAVWNEAEQEFEQASANTPQDSAPEARAAQLRTGDRAALVQVNQIHGYLKFEADFLTPSGQIPVGHAKMRLLYVCAWEKDGPNDFANAAGGSGDDFLGCARADRDGYYNIVFFSYRGPDIYLVTALCDADDTGNSSDAEVCVRADKAIGLENGPSQWKNDIMPATHRKYMWTYEGGQGRGDFQAGETRMLSWNLSCPAVKGWGLSDVTCPSGTVGTGGSGDNQNSNHGWNKEAVHAFRAGVETVKTFDTMKPNASNTGGGGRLCLDDRCQDEINVHIADANPGSGCSVAGSDSNRSSGYDVVCLTTPTDPFRVVHELGHNIHRRWMKHSGPVQDGFPSSWCDSPDSQKSTTAEGWANFVSAISWFNDDDAVSVRYQTRTIESSDCTPNPPPSPGEGYVAGFFWDLFDDNDSIDLSYWDIIKVWSFFHSGKGDQAVNESGADGRNVADYVFWFKFLYPGLSSEVDDAVTRNSLEAHS